MSAFTHNTELYYLDTKTSKKHRDKLLRGLLWAVLRKEEGSKYLHLFTFVVQNVREHLLSFFTLQYIAVYLILSVIF